MRATLFLSPAAVLLAFPAPPALAQTAPTPDPFPHVAVRLSFKTVAGCPPERAFRAEVASWVGYDPFTADGVDLITIWFERAGPVFSSSFSLTTPEHKTGVHTEVEASCTGLYRTMGIGVGLTIAPSDGPLPVAPAVVLPEVAAEPVVAVVVAPAPAVAAPPPPVIKPEPPPAKRNVGLHVGVDAVFNPFVAPSVSLGFAPSVGVRLREPAISINLAMRALWSVKPTVASDGEAYRWTYTSGVLAAAWHKSFFFGGPLVEAGTLTARASHAFGGTQAPGFVAVGLHGGIERSLADLFTLHAMIEGEYVPLGTSLRSETRDPRLLWAMPSVSATVAAGITFPLLW